MGELKRNLRLGQVWTPDDIAEKMVAKALLHLSRKKSISILDPAVGPFTFPRAFLNSRSLPRIASFTMYDVDARMVKASKDFCPRELSDWRIKKQDYILSEESQKHDLVIMNPPYVRQEEISQDKKEEYYNILERFYHVHIDRRSNLFVLFLLKALIDTCADGIVCAIVYDAISSSRYGKLALELMNRNSELVFSEHVTAPFGDALIDAQILIWKKTPLGSQKKKSRIASSHKSTAGLKALSELMHISRGYCIPYRGAFVIPDNTSVNFPTKEILIKQKNPNIFTCESTSFIVASTDDKRAVSYIKRHLKPGQDPKRILLSRKERIGDVCFNYYLRDRPRHLLNIRRVQIADNFYVGTVLNNFPIKAAWVLLNSDLFLRAILSCGRNQGDGLIKLQAYEYKSVLVPDWMKLSKDRVDKLVSVADVLLATKPDYATFRSKASAITNEVFQ
jgi:predicted RNA methylase